MVFPDAFSQPKAPGPIGRLLLAIRNRRAHRRISKTARIFLFSDRRFLTPAILMDESDAGALVWSPKARFLAEARFALNHNTGEVFTLEQAWSQGKRAGYRYTSRDQLDVYSAEPEFEHVRAFWATMAGPRFH
jgi:hypothetical protein